jgi:ParB-like chromosome segregation protein Spo0J
MADDTLRTRAEIADRLGKSEPTVSRWIAKGVLPVRRLGPFPNSPFEARASDVDALARKFGGDE